MNRIKNIFILIIFLGILAPVNAHGVDVTPQSTIVIADNSTGIMAKNVVNEMGLNVSVYNFKSSDEVSHQLEHVLSNPDKKIMVVAYQDTANDFISKNPGLSDRIIISSANENDIKNGLKLLTGNNGSFLTPLLAGFLIGIIAGLAGGAFWMKRKIS